MAERGARKAGRGAHAPRLEPQALKEALALEQDDTRRLARALLLRQRVELLAARRHRSSKPVRSIRAASHVGLAPRRRRQKPRANSAILILGFALICSEKVL